MSSTELEDYADREYDLLHALFRGHLTSREYGWLRRLALMEYGYREAARASTRRFLAKLPANDKSGAFRPW